MAVDEFGREEGVDYSDQSWTVHGYTVRDPEKALALASYVPVKDPEEPQKIEFVVGQEPQELLDILGGS